MDLILCHTTADFDTLGAAVGLARLQPGSRIVLTGGCHPTVQRFLALHRDEYPLIERRAVDSRQIRSLTLVDAQQPDRFGAAAQWMTQPQPPPIRVYDHHPYASGSQPLPAGVIEPVGAATTLVVEAMQRQGIRPTLAEATVMALGIHVDTGSLVFEQTTLRDAQALTWLMEQGANLQVIAEFVEPGLSPQLQNLLTVAMARLNLETVQGYSLAWVVLAVDHYIAGLSGIAERLISLADVDLLLFAAHYPGKETSAPPSQRLLLVGRAQGRVTARPPRQGIDWGVIFTPLGGGGHAAAAAVTLTTDSPAEVVDQVLTQARSQLPRPPTAQDLMSSPVRTIRPETTMAEAQRVLLRYGHAGLSVVDGTGKLVGMIARRDLDLALHHGLSHAPVKGYMATNLKTINPQTPLSEIEELMVTYDIGRLPVIHQGSLVGIVTRTDLLRHLHQNLVANGWRRRTLPPTQVDVAPDLQKNMAVRLGPELQQVLGQMAAVAQSRGWHLYLVGGVVRDLLLPPGDEVDWIDLDLVVDSCHQPVPVGAAAELAEQFQTRHPEIDIQIHGQFQTASLVWSRHLNHPLAALMIDIATARTEFYPYPAANPEVEASSIQQDLYRRDFTVNALALRLTSPGEGELLDYFGGLMDLRQGMIRVLHPNSFIEDPTRIFRAVRFAVRLGFRLDSQTAACIRHAIDSGIYTQLQHQGKPLPSLEVRLKNELRSILQAPYWEAALTLLDQLQGLRCLHADLVITPLLWHQLRRLNRWLQRFPWGASCVAWEMRLEILIAAIPAADRRPIAAGLQLTDESIGRLDQLEGLEASWQRQVTDSLLPSQLYRLFRPVDLPMLLLISNRHPRALGPSIWRYLTQWLDLTPLVNGEVLKSLGYKPGPNFRRMLEAILAAQLDGLVHSQDQALEFLACHYPLESTPSP